jgi:hypothetical protein
MISGCVCLNKNLSATLVASHGVQHRRAELASEELRIDDCGFLNLIKMRIRTESYSILNLKFGI